MLLAAFDERRPTRDVDLAGLQLDNAIETVSEAIVEIASIEIDDGLAIATDAARAEAIREESAGYTGVRISLPATLASARVSFHVDINLGDPIEPAPEATSVPRILGGTIEVLGYSVEMVIAEKLVTAVQRGTANTRWRDFVDLHRIVRSHSLSAHGADDQAIVPPVTVVPAAVFDCLLRTLDEPDPAPHLEEAAHHSRHGTDIMTS